ncbi:cell wall-active antibiotics response protein LiaF [Lentibacillus salinarum]|uniref:Cell wall-active antibiotics response protein LiaF n=1 Tax=Lentibacillus salinarum TaxID=446820 RepID=A0ABW3ZS26_9BACI
MVRYMLAVILIAAGAALVLANIGIIDFNVDNAWFYIYPILLIGFGMKWMADRIRQQGGSWIFGSFFFIFGLLLLLDRFSVIMFHFDDVFKLWPLLIVYVGFSFIGRSRSHQQSFARRRKQKKMKYAGGFDSFTVGTHEYNQPNWKVEPMNLKNMAGDFHLDFSKAFIPENEIPIAIKSLAGDVHIVIPGNLAFRIDAYVKAGEMDIIGQVQEGINRDITYETPDYDQAVQKLDLFIDLKAGSIKVVNV